MKILALPTCEFTGRNGIEGSRSIQASSGDGGLIVEQAGKGSAGQGLGVCQEQSGMNKTRIGMGTVL